MTSHLSDAHDFLDDVNLLADLRDELAVQLKRADLLDELGLLDEQARDALSRRVRLWREAVEAFGAA